MIKRRTLFLGSAATVAAVMSPVIAGASIPPVRLRPYGVVRWMKINDAVKYVVQVENLTTKDFTEVTVNARTNRWRFSVQNSVHWYKVKIHAVDADGKRKPTPWYSLSFYDVPAT